MKHEVKQRVGNKIPRPKPTVAQAVNTVVLRRALVNLELRISYLPETDRRYSCETQHRQRPEILLWKLMYSHCKEAIKSAKLQFSFKYNKILAPL